MAFALRCPDCRKAFKWNPTEPDPEDCPLCGAVMPSDKSDGGNVVCLPAFLSAATKANDKVYRNIERSSEVRVEKAAETAGVPTAEMASLRITDLRETRHEGAIAAVPVQNAITQQMDIIRARGGQAGFAGPSAMEYSSAVQTGPHPNMGAKMRTMIHQSNGAVSDRPALETKQPGYRIRG